MFISMTKSYSKNHKDNMIFGQSCNILTKFSSNEHNRHSWSIMPQFWDPLKYEASKKKENLKKYDDVNKLSIVNKHGGLFKIKTFLEIFS